MKPRSLFDSSPTPALLSRTDAKALADRILAMARADSTQVSIDNGWEGNTRFADGGISTSGESVDTTVTVTSTIGKRRASATTNVLEDASLRRTVDLAERLAKLAPEDPELMPPLGPQTYSIVNSFIDATAGLGPEGRAAAARKVIERASEVGKAAGNVFVAGFLDVNGGSRAIANSGGLFAYHRSTDVNLSTTVRTPDGTGSGWASAGARDCSTLD
ncbi:MAG: TldD/PmbA family protein, partial [Gemmatimonadota bacterium]|nr:TldD/PmbA family protein [Gemmatimonadota bacterium]